MIDWIEWEDKYWELKLLTNGQRFRDAIGCRKDGGWTFGLCHVPASQVVSIQMPPNLGCEGGKQRVLICGLK